jgi:hypothetical protein
MSWYVLVSLAFVTEAAIIVALIWKYVRTRDIGFIWLLVAVCIWPAISQLLDHVGGAMTVRVLHHQYVGFYPFTAIERGQLPLGATLSFMQLLVKFTGAILMLVAILHFHKRPKTVELP